MEQSVWEIIIGVFLGVALGSCCGFRVFIPMLVASIAIHAGYITVNENFMWLGSTIALIIFGVASLLEVLAYYIPAVDNMLDVIGTPMSVIAGTLLGASFITDMSPIMQWSLAAVVAGGGAAVIHSGMATIRAATTATTAGLGNSLVSTVEAAMATLVPLLSIALPIVAVLVITAVLVSLCLVVSKIRRKMKEKTTDLVTPPNPSFSN